MKFSVLGNILLLVTVLFSSTSVILWLCLVRLLVSVPLSVIVSDVNRLVSVYYLSFSYFLFEFEGFFLCLVSLSVFPSCVIVILAYQSSPVLLTFRCASFSSCLLLSSHLLLSDFLLCSHESRRQVRNMCYPGKLLANSGFSVLQTGFTFCPRCPTTMVTYAANLTCFTAG